MLCGAKIALNTTQSSQSIMSEEVGPDVEEISRMQGEISSLQKEMEKMSKESEDRMKILQQQQQQMMAAQQEFMRTMLNIRQSSPKQPPTAPATTIYEASDAPKPSEESLAKDTSKSSEYQPSGESYDTETPDPPQQKRKKRQPQIEEDGEESVPSTVSSSERPIVMDSDEYHMSDDFKKPPPKREKSTLGGESFYGKKIFVVCFCCFCKNYKICLNFWRKNWSW